MKNQSKGTLEGRVDRALVLHTVFGFVLLLTGPLNGPLTGPLTLHWCPQQVILDFPTKKNVFKFFSSHFTYHVGTEKYFLYF